VASGALVAGVVGATIATSAPSAPAAADAQLAQPASTPSGSAAPPSARPGSPPSFRWPGRYHAFPFGGVLFPGGAVHGQFVAPAPGGGFQTKAVQSGQVTAVSGASITVRSADNYTKTYRVTSAARVFPGHGISSVKTGDQVRILATVHGPAATVTTIIDLSKLPSRGPRPGGGQHWPAAGSGA
jgi:hypothetical protein